MSRPINIKYCTQCGAPVNFLIPEGDNMPRHVCSAPECAMVHYQNPKIVAGCIVEWQNKLLLCKRAIEPRSGLWTIPAGFMENGETVNAAAARETWEEALARVGPTRLFAVYNIPRVNQVYIIFRAELRTLEFGPGAESLEVELFEEIEVPWSKLAFPVVHKALAHYFLHRDSATEVPFVDDIG